MKDHILTERQKQILEAHLSGLPIIEYDPELAKLIDDAEALMRELNAYDELEDDLLKWYYNKCKELEKL